MSGPVRRDSEHVLREYDREKWPLVEEQIQRAIEAEGAQPSLSRVLRSVARWEDSDASGSDGLGIVEGVFAGRLATAPALAHYGAHRHLVVETVTALALPDADLVVELGSGTSLNVLAVWLAGGPADALYVGAEFTAAGRRCGELLAGLEPRLRSTALAFDYHQPDLSSLPRVRRAVVFSCHSVEQIPHLSAAVVDAVAGLADDVVCVHFEPVGWQVGSTGGSSAEYAERHDYNRNLVPLLQELEAQGRLRIESILPDVVGIKPGNVTTVVVWRPTA